MTEKATTAPAAVADVRRFTGYVAADGSHHATLKAAAAVSLEVKTRAALDAVFADVTQFTDAEVYRPYEDDDTCVIAVKDMPKFIYANRVAILAALNQEVSLRKPRKPRADKGTKAAKPAAVAVTATEAL